MVKLSWTGSAWLPAKSSGFQGDFVVAVFRECVVEPAVFIQLQVVQRFAVPLDDQGCLIMVVVDVINADGDVCVIVEILAVFERLVVRMDCERRCCFIDGEGHRFCAYVAGLVLCFNGNIIISFSSESMGQGCFAAVCFEGSGVIALTVFCDFDLVDVKVCILDGHR